MTRCNQHRCRYCYMMSRDDQTTVCITEPTFTHMGPNNRVWAMHCMTYLKREPGDKLGYWSSAGPDGLYPGQIKPQQDHYDEDPEEEPIATVGATWHDGVKALDDQHRDTLYVTEPDLCDT